MKIKSLIGLALIALSFYSIGPVLCDELFENTCYRIHGSEHFYTVLPLFLVIFATGLIIFLKSTNLVKKPQRKIIALGLSLAVITISVATLFLAQPYTIRITEMKSQYVVGEPISFKINAVGFGNVCSEPHVSIVRIDRPWPQDGSNIIWSNNYQTGCIGKPQYEFFNSQWETEDVTDGPLVIYKTGKFKLSVSHGNRNDVQEFVITKP